MIGSARLLLALAGVYGALAVGLGAFAAHGMEARFGGQAVAWVETGSRYQMVHAVAMAAIALALGAGIGASRWLAAAGWAFAAGALVFPGTLYLLAFTPDRFWAMATPFGGLALIVGWGLLVVAALARR
ncbi:MAG: DUF423 domain-containing protein [Alphaproteobacteria bacterium]|jgi:uncharacterized membrane protein YgdD (TMEM256/DUF423 family)|nr:DUF423 domain-containing protein [Alphaproteobacteria bacterium]